MPDDLQLLYEARIPLLRLLAERLQCETEDALFGLSHIDRIVYRVKGSTAFAEKAIDPHNYPPYVAPLIEIEDQVAGRVIVFFADDIGRVEERLAGTFRTVERADRHPARDSEFGYESRHFIYTIPAHLAPADWVCRSDVPTTFELQVRTLMMHAYAEPQHDLQYKAARDLPAAIRRELAWIAASAWGADQALERVRAWSSRIDGEAP